MANFVFNAALGRVAEKAADGAVLKMMVLKSAASDAVLKDLDTIAAVLSAGSVAEADFTNYARKTLSTVTTTVDDTGDSVKVDCADVIFTAAGGALNNTTTDVIIYEFVTDDSDSVPLVQLDAVFTTDGNNITLQIHENGFFGAS